MQVKRVCLDLSTEVPAADPEAVLSTKISEFGFETVDFSGCFSNIVSKIERLILNQSTQVLYSKSLATVIDPNGIRTRVTAMKGRCRSPRKSFSIGETIARYDKNLMFSIDFGILWYTAGGTPP